MHYIIYTKNNQETIEIQESYESALESYDSLIQDSNIFSLYYIRKITKITNGVKEDFSSINGDFDPYDQEYSIINDEDEINKYLKEMYELEHGLVE